jgi:hypothetical protein
LRGRRQKAKEGDAEYRKVTTPVSELTMKHHMYHTAEQIAPANVNVFKIYQDENKSTYRNFFYYTDFWNYLYVPRIITRKNGSQVQNEE